MMNELQVALHGKVDEAYQALILAERAGHEYEVHLHGARIRDLLDIAVRHGIDTVDWVDPAVLQSALMDA